MAVEDILIPITLYRVYFLYILNFLLKKLTFNKIILGKLKNILYL